MINNNPVPSSAGTPTDARNRAVRTFVQGLATDVLVAVVLLLWPAISDAKSLDDFNWSILWFSLGKTVVITGISYVMRALGVSPQTTTR